MDGRGMIVNEECGEGMMIERVQDDYCALQQCIVVQCKGEWDALAEKGNNCIFFLYCGTLFASEKYFLFLMINED